MAELLTEDEKLAVQQAADLWGTLCRVTDRESTRSDDLSELATHVHAIQHAVMANAASRAYPDLYRRLGNNLEMGEETMYQGPSKGTWQAVHTNAGWHLRLVNAAAVPEPIVTGEPLSHRADVDTALAAVFFACGVGNYTFSVQMANRALVEVDERE